MKFFTFFIGGEREQSNARNRFGKAYKTMAGHSLTPLKCEIRLQVLRMRTVAQHGAGGISSYSDIRKRPFCLGIPCRNGSRGTKQDHKKARGCISVRFCFSVEEQAETSRSR